MLPSKHSKEQAQLQEEAKVRDEQLNLQLKRNAQEDQRIHKLLLLGSGESGKSTLFKQLSSIYGDGISSDDLKGSRVHVYQNIVQALRDLAEHIHDVENPMDVMESNIDALEFYKHVSTDGFEFTDEHYRYAKQLWADPAIQQVWNVREVFHVPESAKFFFERLDEIAKADYIPTHDDFLRIRVRTTGIVQKKFGMFQNIHLQLFSHCFPTTLWPFSPLGHYIDTFHHYSPTSLSCRLIISILFHIIESNSSLAFFLQPNPTCRNRKEHLSFV